MKRARRGNALLIGLIILIGVTAYAGFRPLFEVFTAGAVKELITALFGTIFTIVLTMILLNKQTEVEEERSRSEAVFVKRSELYASIIRQMKDIMADGVYTKDDIQALDAIFYQLQLVSSNEVIGKFVAYYKPVKQRVLLEVGAQAHRIQYNVSMQREDRESFGAFVNECRVELRLAEEVLPPSISDAIRESMDLAPAYMSKEERARRKLTVLSTLTQKLEEVGGPERDGDLFEEVIGKEDEILQLYGLPSSTENQHLLYKGKKGFIEPDEIEGALKRLDSAACAGEFCRLGRLNPATRTD